MTWYWLVLASQILMAVSSEAEASLPSSLDHAIDETPLLCPLSVAWHWPVVESHILMVLSEEAEASLPSSFDHATDQTQSLMSLDRGLALAIPSIPDLNGRIVGG